MVKYIVLISLFWGFTPSMAATPGPQASSSIEASYSLAENGTAALAAGTGYTHGWPKRVVTKIVTAYSSTPEETDDTPFITASGKHVHQGTAAANWLPFGTLIRLPEVFGNRIFVIEDRMAPKNWNKVDIWFPEKKQSDDFGLKVTKIEIL